MEPLVSCIMPTFNRARFTAQAIRYFARQDYATRELIVVDDGSDAARPEESSSGAAVRYIRLDSRKTVGEKRNIACEAAQGEIILHWDDDDWQASWRISYQVRELLESGANVCGVDSLLYFDPRSAEAWRYTYPPNARRWVAGNSLCYRRTFWERHRFPHVNVGEDAKFTWQAEPAKVARVADSRFLIGVIHAENASPKLVGGQCWSRCSVSEAHALIGEDLPFYAAMQKRTATARPQALVAVAKGIGDILRATPLVRVLHLQGYDVDVLIEPDYGDTASLLEGAPEIRRLVRTAPRDTQYDLAAFTYWAAKHMQTVRSHRSLTFNRNEWLKFGDTFCITQMAHAAGWTRELPAPFAMASDRKFDLPAGTVALHPGCKPDWPWKKWHGFAELAELLPHVAIIGTTADLENRATYFRGAFAWPAHARNFINALSLKDTAALLKQCAAVVSNDSGMMHLAAALGTPTFGIFGITSPAREAMPLANMFPVTKGLDCEPACRQQPWGRRDCDRHLECLRTLTAAEVQQRLVSILPGPRPAPANDTQSAMDRLTLVYHGHPFDATGYGTAARAYIHALHGAGVDVAVRDLSRHPRQVRDELIDSLTQRQLNPDFHLFHGIPPEWAREAFRLSNAIGMTVWETDCMPSQWRSTLNHVLETWLPCDFNVEAFQPQLSRPVFKLPHPVIPRPSTNGGPDPNASLGTSAGDFVVYSIFEWQDRKFPEGQIAAYLRAFPDGGNVVYVLKSNPGAQLVASRALADLRRQTGSRARVELRCEAWSEEQIEALHRRGDCYLSLHRGEGWGYPLFEAACRGTPAVATAHSGPLEYLNGDTHALVRWSPVTVRQPYIYYNSRMKWAEPDVDHAAGQLRFIAENRECVRARAAQAAENLRNQFALEAVGAQAKARLMELLERTNRRTEKDRPARPTRAAEPQLRPPAPIPGDWFDADYFENGIKSNWKNGYTWKAFQGLFSDTAGFLTTMFPSARSFLDAGCAKGFLVRALRDRGAEAWGFDISRWAIDHADAKAKDYVSCQSTDSAAFDRTFDVVIAMDLLTQLTEPQVTAFLDRARAWTRVGLLATISDETANQNGNRDFSHVTCRDRAWWHERFLSAGWRQDDLHLAFEQTCQHHDLPRRMNWRVLLYAPK